MHKICFSLALMPLLLVSCSCGHVPAPAANAPATATATPGSADDSIAPVVGAAVATPDQVLRLTLTDEQSGAPVYHAGLNLLNSKSLQWTDQKGRWQWSGGGFAREGAIEIRCPALRAETGRKIDSVPYSMKGPLTDVSATVDTKQCIEPPEKSTSAPYKGTFFKYYANGYFIPCAGLPADAAFYGNSKSAWVTFSGATASDLKDLLPADDSGPESAQAVHVEWTGTLTGPGAYGPQGVSAYKINVSAVGKASADFPDDCPAADLQ